MSRTSQVSTPEALPRPVVVFPTDYARGEVIAPHRHGWAQLIYASEGVMTVSAETGNWVVPPQRAVWVPAGMVHSIVIERAARMRSLYVLPDAAPGLPRDCCVVSVPPLLRALILRAATLPRLYDEDGADGRLMRVLLDEIRHLPSAPLHLPRPSDPRLARVTDALLRDPADDRPFSAWARIAGASPRTLARLFAAQTGLSFRAYRQRARLLRALVELARGAAVTTVAIDLGYDSPSAFIAAFKRTFGVTPSRYFRPAPGLSAPG